MERLLRHFSATLSICMLSSLILTGQDKYPKSLPDVDLRKVRQISAVPDHDMEYDPVVGDIISQTNLDSLVAYVRILSGEDSVLINGLKVRIQNRESNPGNDLAADYIMNKLESYHLEVHDQIYSQEGRNIYAVQPGILFPEKQYIICAHYDAVDDYCADDNASGVAAVLEAARLLSRHNLKHTLVFALWDQEEIGMVGSNHYASQAKSDMAHIQGVLNMDMIGWDSNGDRLVDIHSSDIANSDSLADLIMINNSLYELNLNPVIYNPGTGASDHSAFWENGYGAVLLIEGYYGQDLNPFYHSNEDRIEKFDLDYFHDLSRLAIGSISSMAGFVEDTMIVVVGTASGYQSYPAAIKIRGSFTGFLDNEETISVWLSKDPEVIEADSVVAQSNTSLLAYFSIPMESSAGLWDVNVENTPVDLLISENSFEILPAPARIDISSDTLYVSVNSGATETCSLSIFNVGNNDLRYGIDSRGYSSKDLCYSLKFDGIDDQVFIGYSPILDIEGDITMSVWFKTESMQQGGLVQNLDPYFPDNGYQLSIGNLYEEGGFVFFECLNDDDRDGFYTDALFTDGEWHFVSAVYSPDGSSRVRLFIDNIERTGNYWGVPLQAIGTTENYAFTIGVTHPDAYFEGMIDEVSIWKRALTQKEIQDNMYYSLTGTEPGLIGYWNFNESSADSVFDRTANVNHGTLEGGVLRVPDDAVNIIEWLSAYPDTGLCAHSSSIEIIVTVNASELDPGEYSGLLTLSSNDPFYPLVEIPVYLTVSPSLDSENTVRKPTRLAVYPNPVTEILHIESSSTGKYSTEIVTLNGQLVYNGVMEGPTHQLDLSSFQSGVYLITIRSKDFVATRKIVKLN